MSFFGSMGNDSGYNVWLNDHTDDTNKGQVGAALAALPVIGTIVGTVLGGALISIGDYQLLFWSMGIFVIVFGAISLFIMKDHPTVKPERRGSFWKQVVEVFNFSKLVLMSSIIVEILISSNSFSTILDSSNIINSKSLSGLTFNISSISKLALILTLKFFTSK